MLDCVDPAVPAVLRRDSLSDHFRYAQLSGVRLKDGLETSPGFFRFGPDLVGFGRVEGALAAIAADDPHVPDVLERVETADGWLQLPFSLSEVVDNFRYERYPQPVDKRWLASRQAARAYYWIRPLLPVSIRRHLQRMYLNDWDQIPFPAWPVDRTADAFLEKSLGFLMQASGHDGWPFIWFWPEGYRSCAIMTHDVETEAGRDFTTSLMDVDEGFGVRSAFQVVPEGRYEVTAGYLDTIRHRGFEVNVHGLDHEGNLFDDRKAFLEAAKAINRYGQAFGSDGFRSPALYRNASWLGELDFAYDMSIPTVARLEAQRGGCCTIMPYFLRGDVLELPLTTSEDYTLFHILNESSIDLWKRQMESILLGSGLMSFLVHPDYLREARCLALYTELLEELNDLRGTGQVWMPLPGEVNQWWRQRHEMSVVWSGSGWSIEGDHSDRARIAYARWDGSEIQYEVEGVA